MRGGNLGNHDRVARVILGIMLLAVLLGLHTAARWIGLLGLVLIGTALVGTCPVYEALGWRTRGA